MNTVDALCEVCEKPLRWTPLTPMRCSECMNKVYKVEPCKLCGLAIRHAHVIDGKITHG